MHGFGIFRWKDGKRYEGEWKAGKKHGAGCSISAEGKIELNHWENGQIID